MWYNNNRKREHPLNRKVVYFMKKFNWFKFVFRNEKGEIYTSIARGFSKQELAVMESKHGKLILKEFYERA